MRRLLLLLAVWPVAAYAHAIVDVGVAISGPSFAAAGSSQSYIINVTDYAYDNAYGVVLTETLPTNAQFVSASGNGWNCSQSKGTVTCSAEQLTPGLWPIVITVKMPSSGTAQNSASVQPLGYLDPNPKNDNASFDTQIYDPAACTAAAPQLLAPGDATELATGSVDLVWSPVADAKQYRIWSAVEGANATVVAVTRETQFHRDAEAGWTEWWVQADFDACPPVTSEHRHFLSHGSAAMLNVTTFAGSGAVGDDDGALTTAKFRTPSSIGIDLDGHIYIADPESSTIRKITADGTVSTAIGVAGQAGATDGTRGFAMLNHPRALAVTAGGYVYIADTDDDTIRLFYPSGNGVVFSAFLGLYTGSIQLPGTTDGTVGNARFDHPAAITVTPNGTLYVADLGSGLVRRVQGPTGNVTTVAGKAHEFNAPQGIAVDANGNVFVADTDDNVIRMVASDGMVSTFAGAAGQSGFSDGLGALAQFNHPTGIAFDALGNLYVADTGNNAIRRIAPSSLVTTVVAAGILNAPAGLAFDSSGRLLIADSGNHLIRIATAVAPATPSRHRSVAH